MWNGLINSFIVAFFVVIISVPIGLGATLLDKITIQSP